MPNRSPSSNSRAFSSTLSSRAPCASSSACLANFFNLSENQSAVSVQITSHENFTIPMSVIDYLPDCQNDDQHYEGTKDQPVALSACALFHSKIPGNQSYAYLTARPREPNHPISIT